MLGDVTPGTPVYDTFVSLFAPGQGLHEVLIGQHGVNDALLDYMWCQQHIERAFINGQEPNVWGLQAWDTIFESMARNLLESGRVTEEGISQLIDDLENTMDSQGQPVLPEGEVENLTELLQYTLSGAITGWVNEFFNWSSIGSCVRVADISFGATPPWLKPNEAAWPEEFLTDQENDPRWFQIEIGKDEEGNPIYGYFRDPSGSLLAPNE
jgi:hypothetical protein